MSAIELRQGLSRNVEELPYAAHAGIRAARDDVWPIANAHHYDAPLPESIRSDLAVAADAIDEERDRDAVKILEGIDDDSVPTWTGVHPDEAFDLWARGHTAIVKDGIVVSRSARIGQPGFNEAHRTLARKLRIDPRPGEPDVLRVRRLTMSEFSLMQMALDHEGWELVYMGARNPQASGNRRKPVTNYELGMYPVTDEERVGFQDGYLGGVMDFIESVVKDVMPKNNPHGPKSSFETSVRGLFTSRTKLDETIADIEEGRTSRSTGRPVLVSRLDSPRRAYFIMDGNHRVVEAIMDGQSTILVSIDAHIPRIERTGGAHSRSVNEKVNVYYNVKKRRGNPPRRNPDEENPHRDAAIEKYKEFWRLDPVSIGEFASDFKIPTRARKVGKAKWVTYRSGKTDPETLEKPKNPIDYIHHHDKGVVHYMTTGTPNCDVPDFLANCQALTLLGQCLGYEFMEDGSPREAEGVDPLPELYTTPDGRALLVIQDKSEILAMMWGGDLAVEGRGIVH